VQRFFKVSDKKMKRAEILIQKYGYWTAAFSFLPVLGEVFLLSLGVMRASRLKVILLMAIGKIIRYAFVTISTIGIAKYFGF
jgi:membrane protein YqaA with SNARE-associated domain